MKQNFFRPCRGCRHSRKVSQHLRAGLESTAPFGGSRGEKCGLAVRVVAIGVADGIHLTMVYTDRAADTGETMRRIISARRSNRRERKIYEQATL